MLLLDTNILSELMRQQPDSHVIQWMDDQLVENLSIATITIAEIYLGIALLPNGKRKRSLSESAKKMFQEFGLRHFSFDQNAAYLYADIVSTLSKKGISISTEDAQIAAICKVNSAVLVTRNSKDFVSIDDLELFNPF